jgi:hypothetical protein
MPWHRLLLIHVFTLLTWLAVGQRVTDATGGFQADRLRILDDPEIDLDQPWPGRYQVETYLPLREDAAPRLSMERGPAAHHISGPRSLHSRALSRGLVGLLQPGCPSASGRQALSVAVRGSRRQPPELSQQGLEWREQRERQRQQQRCAVYECGR